MPDASSPEDSEDDRAIKVLHSAAAARKSKAKRSAKQDIAVGKPLTAGLQRAASKGNNSREELWLEECEELYSKLPKASRYAQHKLKVLSKAIDLLKRDRADRTQAETCELLDLLRSLKVT